MVSKLINLEEFFRDGIENFRTTIISGEAIRGYGKSYDLNKLSKIYNIPVVYSTKTDSIHACINNNPNNIYSMHDFRRGMRVDTYGYRILVDEITLTDLNWLIERGYTVIGVIR